MVLRKIILLSLILVGLFWAPFSYASVQQKEATLWGETFSYQLVILTKSNVSYDGKAFTIKSGAKKIRRVVLNNAYFEKEANELWNSFLNGTNPSLVGSPQLMAFLAQLKSLHGNNNSSYLLDQLVLLKRQLQYASWYDIYKKKLEQTKNSSQAKKEFKKEFIQLRMATIEAHELSHLLDEIHLEQGQGKADEQFAHDTEVKAFLTELVYGANPRDSLWQVVTGALDEIKAVGPSDDSIHKLTQFLETARNVSWIPHGNELCFLCYLSHSHAEEVARLVYRNYPVLEKI